MTTFGKLAHATLGLDFSSDKAAQNAAAWKALIGEKKVPARLQLLFEEGPRSGAAEPGKDTDAWKALIGEGKVPARFEMLLEKGVRLGAADPNKNTDAWKTLIGERRVSARLELLPEKKVRRGALGTSVFLQFLGLVFLVTIPMFFPEKLVPIMRYESIPLATPPTAVPLPPKPPQIRARVTPPAPTPVEPPKVAKLFAPAELLAPKLKSREVKPLAAPKLNPEFNAASLVAPEVKRPRAPVETGMLPTGSAAPATVNRPIQQVQTGGFGDPNGVAGDGNPNKRANINRKGSLDLPGGPGYGNGTGGANGVRGTVASAGFGNGIAIPPSSGPSRRGTVQQAGFGDATAAAETPRVRAVTTAPALQPVEILYKPEPAYTEEARRLRIEGDVLVEVVLTASGEVRVIRVVRGLGHGLDESAIRAAQQIRFKPARREGQPVDFPATVHIVFQMAY